MATPVQVQFNKPSLPWNVGESAWFAPAYAATLVAAGTATLVVGGPSYTPPAAWSPSSVTIGVAGVVES